jgi:hypothetical protein
MLATMLVRRRTVEMETAMAARTVKMVVLILVLVLMAPQIVVVVILLPTRAASRK